MHNNVKQLIQSRVSLAPMAGITDYVLRSLVRKYSPNCLLTTEMISSEFLAQTLNGRSGTEIFKRAENHSPISYQISGHKPELMNKSAKFLSSYADMIDINMGCPVNKVVKGQDGAALMRNPSLAKDLVKAVKEGTDKPVSVKFRLGYTVDEMNYVEFGQQMQEAGADFITIHGRTRSQMYSGKADWKKIKELKNNVDVPVFSYVYITWIEQAEQYLTESQAEGVAIGRAAMGDPTLIYRIEHYLHTGEKLPNPTIEEKVEIIKTHINEEIALRGENVGIKFVRKFYPYYIAGLKNAAKVRSLLVTEDSYEKIMAILNELPSVCYSL